MSKSYDEEYPLIEEMSKNNFQWSYNRLNLEKTISIQNTKYKCNFNINFSSSIFI